MLSRMWSKAQLHNINIFVLQLVSLGLFVLVFCRVLETGPRCSLISLGEPNMLADVWN